MPKLSIHRISEFENRARKIKLEIDGLPVCTIKNGEHITLDVPLGKHSLQAKIDWCSSNRIEWDATADSHPKIMLSSGDGFSLFRTMFRPHAYLKLTESMKDQATISTRNTS